jgi:hypothetical protein
MDWFIMFVIHFCLLLQGSSLRSTRLISVLLLWSEVVPVILLHQAALVSFCQLHRASNDSTKGQTEAGLSLEASKALDHTS